MAFDPVFTPDEKFVWVPVKSTNEIVVVDDGRLDGSRAHQGREASSSRSRSCFPPTARTAFVTNNNKMDHMADPAHAGPRHAGHRTRTASLVVVDAKTRKVEKAIPLGKNLTGMGRRSHRIDRRAD